MVSPSLFVCPAQRNFNGGRRSPVRSRRLISSWAVDPPLLGGGSILFLAAEKTIQVLSVMSSDPGRIFSEPNFLGLGFIKVFLI